MALYNEILVGRFNRALQKMFGMKGGPPAAQLAGEIAATVSMYYGIENRVLEGWDLFGVALNQAAVAAVLSGIRFRNPLLSGAVIVIDKLTVMAGAAEAINLSRQTTQTDLATVVATGLQGLDPRGRPKPAMVTSRDASGAVADLIGLIGTFGVSGANVPYDYMNYEANEIPLLPGEAIQITGNTVNTNLIVGLRWRERPIEDSERVPI